MERNALVLNEGELSSNSLRQTTKNHTTLNGTADQDSNLEPFECQSTTLRDINLFVHILYKIGFIFTVACITLLKISALYYSCSIPNKCTVRERLLRLKQL